MRLTQLKLAGFKSFVEPTTIPTPSRLVGVVGPNGCGKSNIIDAVRWVMGESRASELRGESMQDVIFNGSRDRKPAARASVELIFDNAEGRAAGQWSAYAEIAVRRVLTRDGGSSYFINGQSVRRRDVHDIFLGTGLGARGYAIIGQGMINRLIEARPEELRVYLEEAAGVSRYKERRRETESRLRDTRENLVRVDDILNELAARLERLESQAETARLYRELQRRAEQARQLSWLLQEGRARREQEQHALAIDQAQAGLEGALARLRAEEAEIESHRQAHYTAADTVHSAQGRLFEANAEVSRLETEMRHAAQARERVRQRQDQLGLRAQHWQAQQDESRARHTQAQDELDVARAAHEQDAAALENAQDALHALERKAKQATEEAEELRRELTRTEQARALKQQSSHDMGRQLQAAGAREMRLADQLRALPIPDAAALAALEAECEEQVARLDAEQQTLMRLEEQLPALQSAQQACAERSREAGGALTELQARLDALIALQNQIQEKSSIQPWLAQHRLEDIPLLWHGLEVTPGWETALEAVLGERMAALEVDDLVQTQRFAADPPPARVAFCRFHADGANDGLPMLAHPGLLDMVRISDPTRRQLLAAWLHGVYICDTLEHALALRPHLPAGHLCVSREGHRVDRHSVRFYAADSDQAGLLARQQTVRKLEEALPLQRAAADDAREEQRRAQDAYNDVASALGPVRANISALTAQLHARQLELTRMQQAAQQAQETSAQLTGELAELGDLKEELLARKEEADMALDALDMESSLHQENYAQASRRGRALHEELDTQRRSVRELERRVQEGEYAERTWRARLDEFQRTGALAAREAESVAHEMAQLEQELAGLEGSEHHADLQEALDRRIRHEEALAHARRTQDDLAAALRAADERRLALEHSLEPLRSGILELQLKEQAARLAVEQFADQLKAGGADRTALEQTLEGAPAHWRKTSWLQAELQRVLQQIESLGAVNLAALDELAVAREREGFLQAQLEDLAAAIATLEDAIMKIDGETRERLRTTFNAVNEHFGALFPQLFGGGQARLSMLGDDILDTGLQVMAQPPGKRNSTIHLLSGGEKALTAIALVFALFKLNPAPFCLLDEVDAPLDDANTERYARLVTAMSAQTQFLFISHNKIAMQMAKRLIGVTMQEQGVSRIVAVDVESAMQMAEV